MASITDYTTLKQAIVDETEDDGSELASFLDTAIDLAEERLFRELYLPELEEKDTGTTTGGITTLTKPTGYAFADYLIVSGTLLKKRQENFVKDYWPVSTNTGTPKYYADQTSGTFLLAPTPDADYSYELKYTKKPTKLSVAATTNYYTDKCQDLLFAATMLEAVKFLKAWSQTQVWDGMFTQLREGWNLQAARYLRDGGVFPMSPDSGPNDQKHTANSNA